MKLFIHRKDLRTQDLTAFEYLDAVEKDGASSLHVLVLDSRLLGNGRHLEHSGRNFIRYVNRLIRQYRQAGKPLLVSYGDPEAVVTRIMEHHPIQEIVWHRDFTPYAIERDRKLQDLADERGITVIALDDYTLIDMDDFQRFSGRKEPYKVFTPFYSRWREYIGSFYRPSGPTTLHKLPVADAHPDLTLQFQPPFSLLELGEPANDPHEELEIFVEERLAAYSDRRDRFALTGTSGLSAAINTGALSIRQVYETASASPLSESWIRQLAWRDFYIYQSTLDLDFFRYEKTYDLSGLSDRHFEAWSKGETGIPLVDAAMTELQETGAMPNRLRMITAMFLTKNLLCPFTVGEQWFRDKLSDYDNVLNRGGWLWSASLGFDPAPYFRIMNPASQSAAHDPEGAYIRKWLPRLKHLSDREIHLPQPEAIVDLKASRARAIEVYKEILGSRRPPEDMPGIEKP